MINCLRSSHLAYKISVKKTKKTKIFYIIKTTTILSIQKKYICIYKYFPTTLWANPVGHNVPYKNKTHAVSLTYYIPSLYIYVQTSLFLQLKAKLYLYYIVTNVYSTRSVIKF